MIIFNNVTGENRVMHNPKYLYFPEYPYKILKGGSKPVNSTI